MLGISRNLTEEAYILHNAGRFNRPYGATPSRSDQWIKLNQKAAQGARNTALGAPGVGPGVGAKGPRLRCPARRSGGDAQRVNIGDHEVANGVVDEPVTLQWAQTGKFVGYDRDSKMAPPIPSARVPDMQMALIQDFEVIGLQRRDETAAYFLDAVSAHGSTRLNGLTATLR